MVKFEINVNNDENDPNDEKEEDQEQGGGEAEYKKRNSGASNEMPPRLGQDGNITDYESSQFLIRRRSRKGSSIKLDKIKISTNSFRTLKLHDFKKTYKLLKCIGQGGYGKVYKVVHKSFKDVRAMKSTIKFNLKILIH